MVKHASWFKLRRSATQRVSALLILLVILSLACSLPGNGQPTPLAQGTELPPATPTPAPIPLPPALLETDPLPGSTLSLSAPVKLYFNQPMERASVEGALSGEPPLSGSFTWLDDTTLTYTPDSSYLPDTALTINLATSAQAANGMTLLQPVSIAYTTAGYLELTQRLPEPDAVDVDPTSAIVAAFNQPVVVLGADPASLPAPLSIQPPATGQGEWINTSTYVFYPQPALAGGSLYSVSIAAGLTAASGSTLPEGQTWSFTTAAPRLVSFEPVDTATNVGLDASVRLTFNQPMDTASVQANFALLDGFTQPVAGQGAWSDDLTTYTFTPTLPLQRNTAYTAMLQTAAASLGGTAISGQQQATWWTVPELTIYGTNPAQGEAKPQYQGVIVYLSAPVAQENLIDYITVEPAVSNLSAFANEYDQSIVINGDFKPEQSYSLVIGGLSDRWGSTLRQPFVLDFHAAPLDPSLSIPFYSEAYFLTPQDPGVLAQVTNLSSIPVSVGNVPLSDFIAMLGPAGYDLRQSYQPSNPSYWEYSLDLPANTTNPLNLALNPEGIPPRPDLYLMRLGLPANAFYSNPVLVAVSNYHMTLKLGATEAFVWVVDLRNLEPAGGLPVSIYDANGALLASGLTEMSGTVRLGLPQGGDPYSNYYAVLGQPGQDNFSLAISNWNQEVAPWSFGISSQISAPGINAYLYTDRPIYRPGQTVYFKAIVRSAFNGRYTLPERQGSALASYPLTLYDETGQTLATFDLPLSAFGSGHASYNLLDTAQPGYYRLANDQDGMELYFQVAEYRKPEINLSVTFREEQGRNGESAVADIQARYFFDAPAGNLPVKWILYAKDVYTVIPGGYQVGAYDTGWLEPYYPDMELPLGMPVAEGSAETAPDGTLILEVPTSPGEECQEYTLEVTIVDESGFPVSARASFQTNPADFHIAVRPDAYAAQAGQEMGFEVLTVDWEGKPSGERTLQAQFQAVTWTRQDPQPGIYMNMDYPRYVPEYELVASSDLVTGADGIARLVFAPPEAGTYMLDISGGGTRTQVLIWVSGPGETPWPSLPNQRIQLTPDKQEYHAGDIAQVFIPNPFRGRALALVTIERDTVLRSQVLLLDPSGTSFPIPLTADEAPNVFVSVTILAYESGERSSSERPDFRQGYAELVVAPTQQMLNVSLTSQPERSGPGATVTLDVRITDSNGSPLQGEFSLAVIDLAALTLADPNAPDIITGFYGRQPLGVRTGYSLAASGQRLAYLTGGIGGGGGGEMPSIARENFPDTAFWSAQIITDADGRASISVTLPDNLTTWQVDVRAVTQDTRVGQAQFQIITSKDLLVRPVTPRFLVAGDHLELAAIAQNNTTADLQASVSLQATGVTLDDPNLATQTVNIPAGGRVRVAWWGTAQDVSSADLLFSIVAGDLQDAVRLASGALPVLRYTAPQTYATSGILDQEVQILELVSLPVTFDPSSGSLNVELAPSLAAAMLQALDSLENYPYDCTEQTLSRFLPNLETYRALQAFGIQSPDLQARLDRTLEEGLNRLLGRQNADGGWPWWPGGESDLHISAYVLFGLSRAQQAGLSIPEESFQRAIAYLSAGLVTPDQISDPWMLDRLAFTHFALLQAGSGDPAALSQLYEARDRLAPWAQALLALSLETTSPGSEQAHTLISDLQSAALRSATGAYWQVPASGHSSMITTLSNSAIVVYALAQRDPASALLPDAVRFLVANRQASGDLAGGWGSTYESAWALMALTEYMKGTGELGGDFAFSATLNGIQIASGRAEGDARLNPVLAEIPLSSLYPSNPNALTILHEAGSGRLYYTAALSVYRPADTAAPLDRGLILGREYILAGEAPRSATPIQVGQVGQSITVRLTLVAPNDMYHLVIEDYIPAGAEILNTSLKTSQQGEFVEPGPLYNPNDPFGNGWGWWLFEPAQIYDDHIAWAADYLPAGTYTLTYTLTLLQPGQYHVLPARAWMFYFPEIQGASAGALFEIKP
ncbi:MAG: Ig-like domain-containing protein [Anaerolineales bacterium]|nr:Ig-like domain-containing protein [Anaerolineales bacterium]